MSELSPCSERESADWPADEWDVVAGWLAALSWGQAVGFAALFGTDANGYIHMQDQQTIRPGSSLSLGVVRGNFLVTAMRDADGNLAVACYTQSGERGANELMLVGGASAGAITSVKLLANEHDRFVTAVRTGGDGLSLRLWKVDPAGTFSDLITNDLAFQTPDAFDSLAVQLMRDHFVAVARRLSTGALQIRSYRFTP